MDKKDQLKVQAWDKLREIDACNEAINKEDEKKQKLVAEIEELKKQIEADNA